MKKLTLYISNYFLTVDNEGIISSHDASKFEGVIKALTNDSVPVKNDPIVKAFYYRLTIKNSVKEVTQLSVKINLLYHLYAELLTKDNINDTLIFMNEIDTKRIIVNPPEGVFIFRINSFIVISRPELNDSFLTNKNILTV